MQTLTETPDHVKIYRPKVIVFTGIPAHRLPLVDFASLITRKLSLMIFADVARDVPVRSLDNLKNVVQRWLKDHHIRGFYSVSTSRNFEDGAISQLNLAGLGKMAPNLALFGYKADWMKVRF